MSNESTAYLRIFIVAESSIQRWITVLACDRRGRVWALQIFAGRSYLWISRSVSIHEGPIRISTSTCWERHRFRSTSIGSIFELHIQYGALVIFDLTGNTLYWRWLMLLTRLTSPQKSGVQQCQVFLLKPDASHCLPRGRSSPAMTGTTGFPGGWCSFGADIHSPPELHQISQKWKFVDFWTVRWHWNSWYQQRSRGSHVLPSKNAWDLLQGRRRPFFTIVGVLLRAQRVVAKSDNSKSVK